MARDARQRVIRLASIFLSRVSHESGAAVKWAPVLTQWKVPEIGERAVYPGNRQIAAKVRTFVNFLVRRNGANPD